MKSNLDVFRSEIWKEIGGIESTIAILSNELELVKNEFVYIERYK